MFIEKNGILQARKKISHGTERYTPQKKKRKKL